MSDLGYGPATPPGWRRGRDGQMFRQKKDGTWWWQASDGHWYPEQQHPAYRSPPPPSAPPPPTAPLPMAVAPGWPADPPRRSTESAVQSGLPRRAWSGFRALPVGLQVGLWAIVGLLVIGAATSPGDDKRSIATVEPTTTAGAPRPSTSAGLVLPTAPAATTPATTAPSTTRPPVATAASVARAPVTTDPPSPSADPPATDPPAEDCSSAYPTVCIPPSPPDLDCGDISFRRFEVLAPDPHGFDGNATMESAARAGEKRCWDSGHHPNPPAGEPVRHVVVDGHGRRRGPSWSQGWPRHHFHLSARSCRTVAA